MTQDSIEKEAAQPDTWIYQHWTICQNQEAYITHCQHLGAVKMISSLRRLYSTTKDVAAKTANVSVWNTRRVVRGWNFFNQTQSTKRLTQPNATHRKVKTLDPQTVPTHNPTELHTSINKPSCTRRTILGTLLHSNIMTVSKTPANKHDSNIPLSMEVYQVSLASVSYTHLTLPTKRIV